MRVGDDESRLPV